MATLSEKYLAGFFDADGCVQVVFVRDCKTPQLRIAFSQETKQDEVLHLIQAEYGGCITYDIIGNGQYTKLSFSGNRQCEKLLNRIRNHTVLKRRYIEVCLDICSRQLDPSEMERVRAFLKAQRKVKSYAVPTFPPRKWLAGYFDGDGCLHASVHKNSVNGGAAVIVHMAAENCYECGVELIQKAYGGSIKQMRENVKQWYLSLPASKATEFLSYFGKYAIVKRSQIEFILKCAEMGHFRDGKNISAGLKHLKAHPHRLSEPKPDVNSLVQSVKDVAPFKWDTWKNGRRLCDSRNSQEGNASCV